MSEESRRVPGPQRNLRPPELELLRVLILKASGAGRLLSELECLSVQEMSDGGMGSLYLVSPTKAWEQRSFGRRIAEVQFNDADGTPVLASLNVDEDGDLYELDVWKVDSTPVIHIDPNSQQL